MPTPPVDVPLGFDAGGRRCEHGTRAERMGLRAYLDCALIRGAMSEPRPEPDVPSRKRCKRFNLPGHAHYLTFSCFQRQPFLSRDRSRQWLIEAVDLGR